MKVIKYDDLTESMVIGIKTYCGVDMITRKSDSDIYPYIVTLSTNRKGYVSRQFKTLDEARACIQGLGLFALYKSLGESR